MKRLRFIVMSLFLPFGVMISFAQKEANIWYFGNQAGLDFNSGAPVVLTNGQTLQTYTYTTISDLNGSLLFYTDGLKIWNKSHNIMFNSTGIGGQQYDAKSVIVIPKPDDPNIYYIFYTNNFPTSFNLMYSEIDMTLNGGLGGITGVKNVILLTSVTSQLTAIKNEISNTYWLISHRNNSNEFIALNISNIGINSTPVTSSLGNAINTKWGKMKFSPNGRKLAISDSDFEGGPNGFLLLCDFNLVTGKVSNLKDLSIAAYGIEFSSNSKILYATRWWTEALNQYNIEFNNESDIINSRIIIPRPPSPTGGNLCDSPLQMAPDGKIYSGCEIRYLDVINNPNVLGIGCNYQSDAIYLGNISSNGLPSVSGYDLPQFIHSTLIIDDISFENVCYGDITNFTLQNTVDSVVWDFGDPTTGANNSSALLEPTHVYSSPGIYMVSANVFIGTESTTNTITLVIYEAPVVNSPVELKQCDDDIDGFSLFNLNEVIGEITANAAIETVTFYESEADANSATNAITNAMAYKNQVVSSDVIWARIENGNGCFRTSQVKLTVTTTQIPSSFIRVFHSCDDAIEGDDMDGISSFDFSSVGQEIEGLFPIGQDLVINYYRNEADALSETDPIVDISDYRNVGYPNSQQIYVRVDSKVDNDCLGLGTHINLYEEPLPEFSIETQQIVCSSDPTFTVVLDPEEANTTENYSYSWEFNGMEISTAQTITVSTPGTYAITLTKTDGTGCSRTREVFVNASELASITSDDIKVVELSDNNSITINTNNLRLGDYEFALDNSFGAYQDEPYFDHVAYGKHILFVQDKKGCGIAQLEVFIMGFPKFFTPNDDGFHDTWNIVGLSNEYTRNSRVYIFDRYGKLLIQLDPKGANWDGTFNGEKLRPSDYWFVAELHNVDGTLTTYRGHFSLVR